jgi:hypothetical protein
MVVIVIWRIWVIGPYASDSSGCASETSTYESYSELFKDYAIDRAGEDVRNNDGLGGTRVTLV